MEPTSPEAKRFERYIGDLAAAVGHADRRESLRAYVVGLLLPGERKSIEPMAAKVDPRHVRARHQSMHHFVANAPWDEARVLLTAREHVLSKLARHSPIAAWIIDDTSMVKKGTKSVGVARQHCGRLGKIENCQVAVTLSLANDLVSVPVAYRLYLPAEWAGDRSRRKEAGVPKKVQFRTKPELALEEIDRLLADAVPRAPVVADAGYGRVTELREELARRDLVYLVGIQTNCSVWPPGKEPLPPKRRAKVARGRPSQRLRRGRGHKPVSVESLARTLPASAWKTVTWRHGTKGPMRSQFAAVRVRAAHDPLATRVRPREWLIVEWPRGATEPTHYWLSNAVETATLDDLVRLATLRWRIERDYEELKSEVGLHHYEGRSWRGFHHHGALAIAAYAFLAAERARLSPPASLAFLRAARLPQGFRPRGASAAS